MLTAEQEQVPEVINFTPFTLSIRKLCSGGVNNKRGFETLIGFLYMILLDDFTKKWITFREIEK